MNISFFNNTIFQEFGFISKGNIAFLYLYSFKVSFNETIILFFESLQ